MEIRALVLLGFYVSCASAANLFHVGQEYAYNYETLVTAGAEEPTSHASAYKLKGKLLVTAISTNTLSVGFEDLTVGLYNGPWSYFPIPEVEYFPSADLAPLAQRFHITIEDGKVKSITLNDQEPEWASNMKRGLATFLQLDLKAVTFNELQVLQVNEMTTMGECKTKYEVIPSTTTLNRLSRVSKFRNHADCPDVPTRTRSATHIYYACPDRQTRDIMNSTAYSTYEMEVKEGQPLLKQLTVFSSVLYWPFTSSGPYQFSWLNMTLTLDSVSRFGNKAFPPPENAEVHEDLTYIFEQSDPILDAEDENPDLRTEPLFFHHISVDSDPETYQKTVEQCHKVIAEIAESLTVSDTYVLNPERFHSNSPFGFIPLVASLDYDHLKQCYTKYSQAATSSQLKLTEFQIFLDGLVLSGTTPAALVIRDILLTTTDQAVLNRLAPSMPHFIRNPTEALAKELDPIFELVDKPELSTTIRRTLCFSVASLIGRSCRKTNCSTTGLLDKYINHFENKLGTATNFEDRTVALHGLRNIKYGRALDRVLDIAAGKLIYEKPVRIQAIWALRGLAYQDRARVFSSLLPVFFNRTESCEVRSSVFGFLMSVGPDERVLHEIAYFMWTETCPQTLNMVRSYLQNAVKTQNPCNGNTGSYAKTILTYLPPIPLDPLRSGSYALDYYDKTYGFGHQIYATVQKTGKSALPLSVYLGFNNYIGGFASSYFGMYIRLEGVGEAISTKIASMRSTNVAEIKSILSKIGVSERPASPLFLELTVVYHDYVLLHYAADESDLSKLPAFLKELGSLSENTVWNWERSLMLGGIFYQFPLEIGTPVSITAGVTGIVAFANNITRTKADASYSQESSLRLQFHLFGLSQITNHAPSIGTMHSVSTYRTLRLLLPRHLTLGVDLKEFALNMAADTPTQKNPILAMSHATSMTSVAADSPTPVKNDQTLEVLKKSCPACTLKTVISRGAGVRKSRTLPTKFPSFLRGLTGEVKYYDCERDHSRVTVVRKLSDFFRNDNKNTGLYNFPLANLYLGLKHARDYIFLSPHSETCGLSVKIAQDETTSTKLDKIEGQIKAKFSLTSDGKQKLNASLSSKLNLKYAGAKPSTTRLKLGLDFQDEFLGTQSLNVNMEANDEGLEQHGVVCISVENTGNRLPKDILDFEGYNEPILEQKIQIKMGRVSKDDLNKGEPPCLTNQADIRINAKALRSAEQKAEAASDISPYKECRSQKGSANYPGPFVPPSTQCLAAALEQTTLRFVNFTASYKLSQELRNKWSRRMLVLGLLSAYQTQDPTDVHSHPVKSKEAGVFEFEVEGGVNVKKDGAVMDIHYRDISAGTPEEHFHDIELSLLPAFLQPSPVPSRISPLLTLGLQSGAYGMCSVTPYVVGTLDGFTYAANLSDCWTLISGDCGPNSQYLILGKRISADKMAIIVHIGENKVEFNGTPDPILDGKPIVLVDKEVYISASGETLPFDIFKNGGEVYVSSSVPGVHVRYTGHFVAVMLNSKYRGLHCGLCGYWDYSPYNDLAGPDTSCPALLAPQNMVKAYTVNEGKCAAVGNQCPA